MKHSRIKRLAILTSALTCATLSYAFDYKNIPVDESLLYSAPPLHSQPLTKTVQRYELLPDQVDRRFTCMIAATSTRIIVEISHTNDLAHTATLQLVNPIGVIEASFLTSAARVARYPDVNLDSYKIRFGEELSTLVVNARRTNKVVQKQMVSGLLQNGANLEIVTCEDEFIDPNSLRALDAPFASNLAEVTIPPTKHPKSMCAITATSKDHQGEKTKFICSAVLIAPNLALTANHCLAKMKDHTTRLTCGTLTSEINYQESVSNPVHNQEQWRVSHDIAIVKLQSEILLPPASLAATASEGADLLFAQTDSCGSFGFGNQFDGRSGVLHGVKFSAPPEDLGGLTLTLENYQNERLITSDPRYFLRPGDSGGGVICQRGEEEVVVGIHSFSYPVDSTVNSASVGHNYQWLIEQIEKINGVTGAEAAAQPVVDETQDPNLQLPSAPINSEIQI